MTLAITAGPSPNPPGNRRAWTPPRDSPKSPGNWIKSSRCKRHPVKGLAARLPACQSRKPPTADFHNRARDSSEDLVKLYHRITCCSCCAYAASTHLSRCYALPAPTVCSRWHPGGGPVLLPCGSDNLLGLRHLCGKSCTLRLANECVRANSLPMPLTKLQPSSGVGRLCNRNLLKRRNRSWPGGSEELRSAFREAELLALGP